MQVALAIRQYSAKLEMYHQLAGQSGLQVGNSTRLCICSKALDVTLSQSCS